LLNDRGMKIALKMDKQRKIALGALAAVAVLAFWPQEDRPLAAPSEPVSTIPPASRMSSIEMPVRDAMPQLARDPFSPEAPKKPVRTVVVSAPAIPVNPYRYAGELRVGGLAQRFLARGDDTFEAKPGDVLEDGWVVESASASAVVLAHRPSGARAALAVGAPAFEDPARARVMQARVSDRASVTGAAPPGLLRMDALTATLPQGYFVKTN
jgi:hypothetical protein